jgi:cytoplasmic iron level regulating protein YaaA (DUF328/UPF0246 family)
MYLLISPAKTLDFERPIPAAPHSEPVFLAEAAALVERLRELAPAELASLMGISDALAARNTARHAGWSPPFTPENARQAVFAYAGDVYEGLAAPELAPEALLWAQTRLGILSGLYGLLRPLDLIQPYRLEMATRLGNARGADLYAWWGSRLHDAVRAAAEAAATQTGPLLVNLASEEYSKAARPKELPFPVIQPIFEDWKNGRYKIISFYAKRARGRMARHAITQRITDPEALKDFTDEGYTYTPAASEATRWVFRRSSADGNSSKRQS